MQSRNPAAAGTIIACATGNFVSATPMVNTVFGLFLIPLSQEFNWARSGISAVLGIVAVVGALAYPVVGRLADLYGARRIVLAGNLLFAGAIASAALANGSLIQFYAIFALIGVTAALPSTVLLTKIVSAWSVKRRGVYIGLTAGLGNGLGATLVPIFAQMLMSAEGWRATYVGLGVATAVIGFPVLYMLLREAPANLRESETEIDADKGMTLDAARRTPTFWMILTAIALGAGCMTAIFAHVIPMLIDRGMDVGRATSVLVVFALVTVAWQVALGFVLDRARSPRIVAPFYLAAFVGLALFAGSSSYPLLLIAGALMGIGLGTEYGVMPYYVSRYFGLKAYGAIYGVMYGTVVLVMGFTPFAMDAVFDLSGSYDIAIYAIEAALIVGAVLISRLRPYGVADFVGSDAANRGANLDLPKV